MFRRKAAPVFTKSPIERVPHTSGSMNAGDFLKIYFTWVYLNTITPPTLEKMENFRTTEERVREISRFPGHKTTSCNTGHNEVFCFIAL